VLEDIHERLSGGGVEQVPWQRLLDLYDRDGALFYLDPPYNGVEGYYGKGLFQRSEYEDMATRLAGLKGRFILSLNDRPKVREIFKGFQIETVTLKYSANRDHQKEASEVIITGL
jgi:DNA adenine methylase